MTIAFFDLKSMLSQSQMEKSYFLQYNNSNQNSRSFYKSEIDLKKIVNYLFKLIIDIVKTSKLLINLLLLSYIGIYLVYFFHICTPFISEVYA